MNERGNGCWGRHVPILLLCVAIIGLGASAVWGLTSGYDARLRQVETGQAATHAKLEAIHAALNRIETELKDARLSRQAGARP